MSTIIYTPPMPQVVDGVTAQIQHEMERRMYLAATELKNASNAVLKGQRSGRRYKMPGTYKRQRDKVTGKMRNGVYYTASAPGEPPAVRLGHFRQSWKPRARKENGFYISSIESDLKVGKDNQYLLGEILENGTPRMAPRPYQERILKKAEKAIFKIYNEPYF